MTFQELCSELEQIMMAESGTIEANKPLAEIAVWDSLARVMFIAMADEKLGREIDAEALRRCRTANNLAELVGVEVPVA